MNKLLFSASVWVLVLTTPVLALCDLALVPKSPSRLMETLKARLSDITDSPIIGPIGEYKDEHSGITKKSFHVDDISIDVEDKSGFTYRMKVGLGSPREVALTLYQSLATAIASQLTGISEVDIVQDIEHSSNTNLKTHQPIILKKQGLIIWFESEDRRFAPFQEVTFFKCKV